MKIYSFFIALFLFFSAPVLGQKVIKHKVKSGESIYALAKKYDITEKEIYELNPKLKGAVLGLKEEVKIPNKKYKPEVKREKPVKSEVFSDSESSTTHLVLAKETLYSISKKYGISMEAICEMNPELKTGNLKKGMTLKLSNAALQTQSVATEPATLNSTILAEPKTITTISNETLIHKVQPKETFFRIAKKYRVSVADLQQLNPTITSGLPVGYDLIIKKGKEKKVVEVTNEPITTETTVVVVKPLSMENLSKADFLIAKASENLGTRYRSGGTTNAGFDCSGLMHTTFKNIDMTLPRSSYDMAKYGQRIDKSQAQKGDLIFFATFGRGRVSHVGMVTEVLDDEIKFIHSSTQSGVMVSSTKEPYYARSFVQVNRVLLE